MMDYGQSALLGLVEGLTEFLPVSSTGHLILVREFFGVDPANGLAIDAVLQLATTLAIVAYFWNDILKLASTALSSALGKATDAGEKRLLGAIVLGTIPALILGFLLEETMATTFRNPELVAWALIAGSAVMLAAELIAARTKAPKLIHELGAGKGFLVGIFQALALVPGMSRSGMTISAGLFFGLTRDAAARFGFLLSVPILAGAGLKKFIELAQTGTLAAIGPELLVGSIIAFLSGIAAIHWLLLFLRTRNLYPFIVYRVVLAGILLFVL